MICDANPCEVQQMCHLSHFARPTVWFDTRVTTEESNLAAVHDAVVAEHNLVFKTVQATKCKLHKKKSIMYKGPTGMLSSILIKHLTPNVSVKYADSWRKMAKIKVST